MGSDGNELEIFDISNQIGISGNSGRLPDEQGKELSEQIIKSFFKG